jgi:hypothetical protein
LLEAGLRLAVPPEPGTPLFADFRMYVANRTAPAGSYLRVPDLGWAMKPGIRFEIRGTRHAVDPLGYRLNDNAPPRRSDVTILAVGGSYTYGHLLQDRETWPARLERRLQVRTVNAGVSGYGLDQMLVQTRKALVDFPQTRTVLVALIADDVDRMRYRVRAGTAKPYFRLNVRGELELVPADHAAPGLAERGDPFQRLFARSYAAHRFMLLTAPGYWNRGTWRDYREAGIDVAAVGQRIVDALSSEVAGGRKLDLVFLLLPASPGDLAMAVPARDQPAALVAQRIAMHAGRSPGVFVADLQSEFVRRVPGEAQRRGLYFDAAIDPAGHFNARGADLAAEIVARFLGDDGSVRADAIPSPGAR